MLDVVVVGAGPSGLFAAALLLQQGFTVRVVEQRSEPGSHSRAIGLHPPGLAALDAVSVGADLTEQGVKIRHGKARSQGNIIASLDFSSLPAPYPFVLAIGQQHTEAALRARVLALDASAIEAPLTAVSMVSGPSSFRVRTSAQGQRGEFVARFAIIADGAKSVLRESMGVRTRHRKYADTYLMGDFADSTNYGAQAVLHLEPAGVVESFPLAGGLRRWVARTDQLQTTATTQLLAEIVADRTGCAVDPATATMLSPFSVQATTAARMYCGRAIIIGDAAHEISPIGGQGMTLGLLDAATLVPLLAGALRGQDVDTQMHSWERRRQGAAASARRQAEVNMTLGRPLGPRMLMGRNATISTVARSTFITEWVARRFTMTYQS
ncbi:MAG: FAD-dependent monooxygenase [Acidobacteria bacterium]|nr:FAD-dependent monooxygenase [Acidobacteriota bacterium]